MKLLDRLFAQAPSRFLAMKGPDEKHALDIQHLLFSSNGQFLACRYSVGNYGSPVVRVWDTTNWEQCHDRGGSGIGGLGMVFSPDSRMLLKFSPNYAIYLVDTTSWTQKHFAEEDLGLPENCEMDASYTGDPPFFSTDGSRFVMHAWDRSPFSRAERSAPAQPFAAILDTRSWKVIADTPRRIAAVCFSRDESLILGLDRSDNDKPIACDGWTGRKLRSLDATELNELSPLGYSFGYKTPRVGWNYDALERIRGRDVSCHSPLDRRLIAGFYWDDIINLFDPVTGKKLRSLTPGWPGQGHTTVDLAVSGDLRHIAEHYGSEIAVWSS